jgi:rhodanese-related sulfurtransferase
MIARMMPNQVPTVSVEQIPPGAFLLDVREDNEWAAGHAPGAHHVPMHDLPARITEIPTDSDVVVACRMGGRSAQVTAYLVQQGWGNVANLAGGMWAWEAAGRPVQRADGSGQGTVI